MGDEAEPTELAGVADAETRRTVSTVVDVGDLVFSTAGTWIIRPPARCPNGHTFGPGRALVGYQACLGHGGGHTTWTCLTCDATVYGPPLNTHCTCLNGPATVRISTAHK